MTTLENKKRAESSQKNEGDVNTKNLDFDYIGEGMTKDENVKVVVPNVVVSEKQSFLDKITSFCDDEDLLFQYHSGRMSIDIFDTELMFTTEEEFDKIVSAIETIKGFADNNTQ